MSTLHGTFRHLKLSDANICFDAHIPDRGPGKLEIKRTRVLFHFSFPKTEVELRYIRLSVLLVGIVVLMLYYSGYRSIDAVLLVDIVVLMLYLLF